MNIPSQALPRRYRRRPGQRTTPAARWVRGFNICDASRRIQSRSILLLGVWVRTMFSDGVLVVHAVLHEVERLPQIADDVVHGRDAEIRHGEAREVLVRRWVRTGSVDLTEVDDEARK